jgi:ubiquinone/menaquinone biosynthesis C-methylase UbiE
MRVVKQRRGGIIHRVELVDDGGQPLEVVAAEALPGVSYARAAAEQLPLQSQSCDLVAAAAASHWSDQTATLAEVRRVVRPGGALLAYTDFFSGRLREC